MGAELFELELFGGEVERRYRKLCPELEKMPWGTLAEKTHNAGMQLAARIFWTKAAFQEYRTGAACAATLQALLQARAPIDLVTLATRFATDEMIHVELCARLAAEFGGGVELTYDPEHLVEAFVEGNVDPIVRASHMVVSVYCVGEAYSLPLLAGSCQATKDPLINAVLSRIVRDEGDHGAFGWFYLDWALPHLSAEDLKALGITAQKAIDGLYAQLAELGPQHAEDNSPTLGWLGKKEYIKLARRSMSKQVIVPLQKRGILPST